MNPNYKHIHLKPEIQIKRKRFVTLAMLFTDCI